jgi:hypothetical protein
VKLRQVPQAKVTYMRARLCHVIDDKADKSDHPADLQRNCGQQTTSLNFFHRHLQNLSLNHTYPKGPTTHPANKGSPRTLQNSNSNEQCLNPLAQATTLAQAVATTATPTSPSRTAAWNATPRSSSTRATLSAALAAAIVCSTRSAPRMWCRLKRDEVKTKGFEKCFLHNSDWLIKAGIRQRS